MALPKAEPSSSARVTARQFLGGPNTKKAPYAPCTTKLETLLLVNHRYRLVLACNKTLSPYHGDDKDWASEVRRFAVWQTVTNSCTGRAKNDVLKSQVGKEYPTDSKEKEGWLYWSHLAHEMRCGTGYWRKDRRTEVTGRRGRRGEQLRDDRKERRGYRRLKGAALGRTLWGTRFGRVYGPVVRRTAEWMNEWMNEWMRLLPEFEEKILPLNSGWVVDCSSTVRFAHTSQCNRNSFTFLQNLLAWGWWIRPKHVATHNVTVLALECGWSC
jgi:hypothetical protein